MTSYQSLQYGISPPLVYSAPTKRSTTTQVRQSVSKISSSPILTTVLEILGGWVAVLNSNRQVLAMNHAFLDKLKIKDPAKVLGLRPGEILSCAHANDSNGGCGTGQFCETCGAALALAAAEQTDQPQERECVLTIKDADRTTDYFFSISCSPFQMEGEKFLLLSMRDISAENRRIALEHTFLHDISNVLMSLDGAVELLSDDPSQDDPALLAQIRNASDTLCREVRVQSLLCQEQPGECNLQYEDVLAKDVLRQVDAIFTHHHSTQGQTLVIDWPQSQRTFQTDIGLFVRVLINMVVNGFEAGEPGDQVRIGVKETPDNVTFHVWNRRPIPRDVQMRIFQRYFSTKSESGHGLGTYAMKLLGETLLKGKVDYTTSESAGTTFSIVHPRRAPVSDDNS